MSERLSMLTKMVEGGSTDPFVWYALGMEYRSMDQPDKALETLTRVAEQFPDYVPTYLMAAQLAQSLAQTDAAKDWSTRGISAATTAGNDHAKSELEQFLHSLGA